MGVQTSAHGTNTISGFFFVLFYKFSKYKETFEDFFIIIIK